LLLFLQFLFSANFFQSNGFLQILSSLFDTPICLLLHRPAKPDVQTATDSTDLSVNALQATSDKDASAANDPSKSATTESRGELPKSTETTVESQNDNKPNKVGLNVGKKDTQLEKLDALSLPNENTKPEITSSSASDVQDVKQTDSQSPCEEDQSKAGGESLDTPGDQTKDATEEQLRATARTGEVQVEQNDVTKPENSSRGDEGREENSDPSREHLTEKSKSIVGSVTMDINRSSNTEQSKQEKQIAENVSESNNDSDGNTKNASEEDTTDKSQQTFPHGHSDGNTVATDKHISPEKALEANDVDVIVSDLLELDVDEGTKSSESPPENVAVAAPPTADPVSENDGVLEKSAAVIVSKSVSGDSDENLKPSNNQDTEELSPTLSKILSVFKPKPVSPATEKSNPSNGKVCDSSVDPVQAQNNQEEIESAPGWLVLLGSIHPYKRYNNCRTTNRLHQLLSYLMSVFFNRSPSLPPEQP